MKNKTNIRQKSAPEYEDDLMNVFKSSADTAADDAVQVLRFVRVDVYVSEATIRRGVAVCDGE